MLKDLGAEKNPKTPDYLKSYLNYVVYIIVQIGVTGSTGCVKITF